MKKPLILLSLLTLLVGCSEPTLTPDEFRSQVNECLKAGGSPSPVYAKDDPIKVSRIDCM